MENEESGTELLENVVINDVEGPQYMIQRLPETSTAQLLGSELLQHNGLVVDLAGGEFIPVTYPSEALLTHDLTEEDRNLAAALVAVQLSQQQKQQQLHDGTLPPLGSKILEQQLILPDNLYIDKQINLATKLNDNGYVSQNFSTAIVQAHEKIEEEKKSDSENRNDNKTSSSRKILPHKKRISRKLKRNNCPTIRYHCNQCEQTFMSSDEYTQHEILCQTTISPIQTRASTGFSCQICNVNIQDQLRFFEHLKSHYEPTTQQQQQQQQQQQLTNKTVVNNVKDSLFTNLLNLTCISCNKVFKKQKSYDNHMKEIHHKENDNNEFSEPEDLMEGITVEDSKSWYREEDLHQTEEDLKELEASEHVCNVCKRSFPVRAMLMQHSQTCRVTTNSTESTPTNTVKVKYKKKGSLQCTQCDRVFSHKNSLVYHLRSHSGVRPHQCDQCGKSFFASSALKVHLRLHSGDRPYNCEACGKNFRQWGDLKYHMTSLHSNERQFQCEYCGKDFARKYSLIVHRRIHTGEKNYKCDYCSKSFRASSYLQNHRKIHTGEKPHECGICGKPFRVRSDMKRHQKTHHSKRGTTTKTMQFSSTPTIKAKEEAIEDVPVVDEDNTILSNYEALDGSVVRDGNLYSHGHQLFLVSYNTDVKNVDTTTTWIHTTT